jgi:ribosomal protein L29
MSINAFKGQPEKDLRGQLQQLADENFKARFTTEAMTPTKGASIRHRRRDVARINTVLAGRKALERAKAEQVKVEERLKALGPAHTGTDAVKRSRRKLLDRKASLSRTIRELGILAGK